MSWFANKLKPDKNFKSSKKNDKLLQIKFIKEEIERLEELAEKENLHLRNSRNPSILERISLRIDSIYDRIGSLKSDLSNLDIDNKEDEDVNEELDHHIERFIMQRNGVDINIKDNNEKDLWEIQDHKDKEFTQNRIEMMKNMESIIKIEKDENKFVSVSDDEDMNEMLKNKLGIKNSQSSKKDIDNLFSVNDINVNGSILGTGNKLIQRYSVHTEVFDPYSNPYN